MARAPVRGVARHLRRAARAHPGTRQARRRTRTARAPAPARGCGSAFAPGRHSRRPRPLGRTRSRARPLRTRGGRPAQRRQGGTHPARPGPLGRHRHPRPARRGQVARRPRRDRPHPARNAVADATRPRRRAHTLRHGGSRALLRRSDPSRVRAHRAARSLPRPRDASQRLVGVVRPRSQPLLRRTGRSSRRRLNHPQRDGRRRGRGRLVARRPAPPAAGLLRVRPSRTPGFADATLSPAGVEPISGLYDLRHTYATFALRAGVPVVAISRFIGSSIAVIDRHYGHLARDSREHAVALMDALALERAVDATWTLNQTSANALSNTDSRPRRGRTRRAVDAGWTPRLVLVASADNESR